jgi:membrane fusion protein, heavy metal efflux system
MNRSRSLLLAALPLVLSLALAALPLLLSAACGRAAAVPPPAPERAPAEVRLGATPEFVKVAPVEAVAEPAVVAATGKVSFDEERVSRVASPVSGRVVELLARPGDRVRKGQGLAVIASPDAQSAIADWVAARADEAVAAKNLDRSRRLFADQAVPYKDVLLAESDATKAAAALARARGRLDVLGVDPASDEAARAARFVLRSPIDGIVVERPAFPGMEVRPDSGVALVTVADLSRVWVLADVYERDLPRVAAGERAEVRVAAAPNRVHEGAVGHVGELVDPATRTVKVRVEVANPRLELKPEMFARVSLQGAAGAPALTVPSSAVLSDGAASAVVVASADGAYRRRTVELGPEQGGRVRVLSGLGAGERVVVDGALFLSAAIDGE